MDAKTIRKYEERWLKRWQDDETYAASKGRGGEKFYCLVMFPYPSGRIHMGHVRNYTIGDVIARYKRLQGFDVIHPMGWDSFGLPAENAAIKNKTAPAKWTYANIDSMRTQLQRLGLSYNWDREIFTCKPEYYRWNQYIFIKMLEKGWAYKKKAPVNWCRECDTVLANEQVVEGCCWRHEQTEVEVRELEQWFFKITEFAEELLAGHEELIDKWPERVLTMQKHWIGKSVGARAHFKLENGDDFPIFTTRIDTVFGVSYMAVAPEHALLDTVTEKAKRGEIDAFRKKVRSMSAIDRENPNLKEGIFTGLNAIHPFTGENIPIYAANFVLPGYGTGAVMAVPAHDQRDFEFAQKYNLPVKQVITSGGENEVDDAAMTTDGILINSGDYTGLSSAEARDKMAQDLEKNNIGARQIQFRLKDWLLSRQRYWGTPIPIVYCDDCGALPVKLDELPVVLPEDVEFTGSSSPLPEMKEFVETTCPDCGKPARRETDTMDTFVDSSWYFARFVSPRDDQQLVDAKEAERALPIDQYIGGIEHATMHLLYARYFTRVLHKFDHVSIKEPFTRLLTQGMVIKDSKKMSKSLGNTVDPDLLIEKYGADTVRLFSMFAAPPAKDLDWSDTGVEGCFRFLRRLYRFVEPLVEAGELSFTPSSPQGEADILKLTHKTLLAVTADMERHSFNTGVARLMEFLNSLYEQYFDGQKHKPLAPEDNELLSFAITSMLTVLVPYAPFFSLEYLSRLGMKSEGDLRWPKAEEGMAVEDSMTIVLQINGKLRDQLEVGRETGKDQILAMAKETEKIQKFIGDQKIVKEIYVPNKLVNLVVK